MYSASWNQPLSSYFVCLFSTVVPSGTRRKVIVPTVILSVAGSLLLESKISPNTAYQKQQVSAGFKSELCVTFGNLQY